MSLPEALGITLMLAAFMIPVVVIFLFVYFAKRLEHKQIMTAIEKGTPLSELRPLRFRHTGPTWIRHIAFGIMALFIAMGFLFSHSEWTLVGFILCGVGVGGIVRGVLCRKYAGQNQSGLQNGGPKNTGPNTYNLPTPLQTNQQTTTPS